MKWFRPVILIVVLVSAFFYLINRSQIDRNFAAPEDTHVTRPDHVQLAEAAAPCLDSEEQENVAVYKKALPSVVNITSTAVAYDFFYGAVPQQGAGSGFVFDSEGHI